MLKDREKANELLDLITLSEKRRNLLLLLMDGPKTIGEINSTLKTISSGMIPQIRKLERANLICQRNKEFALTESGTVVACSLDRLLGTLEAIGKHADFWRGHNSPASRSPSACGSAS